ncbi:VOC family protein [Pigmentiphaga soli]|uniref:VOC family protein n=1 Tax=Pigmentiphaga soli TaxID=1007095 RepID=A0ABP8HC78_9BURK
MPELAAYLNFDGNCAEAMNFYAKVLGGKPAIMTVGQSPMRDQLPPEAAGKVMHSCVTFDGGKLMAADAMPGCPSSAGRGASLALTYPTPQQARPVFDALAEGGKVTMPMQKTFFSEAFGSVVDRFGVTWLVNGGLIPG